MLARKGSGPVSRFRGMESYLCVGAKTGQPLALLPDFPMRGNTAANVGEEQLKSRRSGAERKMGCARLRLQQPLLLKD